MSAQADPFDLNRFITAQSAVYETVVCELQASRKRTHWMWYIFPQLRELGRSATAQFFGFSALEEAQAFLVDPVLGPRLCACTTLVLESNAPSLYAVFGNPDDFKFRSCMTLFAVADGEANSIFNQALQRYANGAADDRTLALLQLKLP